MGHQGVILIVMNKQYRGPERVVLPHSTPPHSESNSMGGHRIRGDRATEGNQKLAYSGGQMRQIIQKWKKTIEKKAVRQTEVCGY